MRLGDYVIAAALAAGLPGTALAQNSPSQPAPQATSTAPTYVGTTESQWLVSGFVGSDFGESGSDASIDYGGQVAYLWHGMVGAELLADFAPSFKINNVFLTESPDVNSYMANAIFALPIGSVGQFLPYVSGGAGGVQMRSTVINSIDLARTVSPLATPENTLVVTGTSNGDQVRFGTNIGAGLLAFAGHIGVRGDARYYRASTDNNLSVTNLTDRVTQSLLSDLTFWRANIGLAFRW